ncbi:MAG: hypothetical protein NC299_04155 [Lachnospiraceae bacterium]|nr:hypothetical protein [Ruminococcus sp.]MCM1274540.1 hypothetical protein [Lachnospiraceae bacterium]
MMHTIVDLGEVFAEPEKNGSPERQNTEEKLDEHIKNAMAFDVMRTMLFNGN